LSYCPRALRRAWKGTSRRVRPDPYRSELERLGPLPHPLRTGISGGRNLQAERRRVARTRTPPTPAAVAAANPTIEAARRPAIRCRSRRSTAVSSRSRMLSSTAGSAWRGRFRSEARARSSRRDRAISAWHRRHCDTCSASAAERSPGSSRRSTKRSASRSHGWAVDVVIRTPPFGSGRGSLGTQRHIITQAKASAMQTDLGCRDRYSKFCCDDFVRQIVDIAEHNNCTKTRGQ